MNDGRRIPPVYVFRRGWFRWPLQSDVPFSPVVVVDDDGWSGADLRFIESG